ncbi:signal peptidase I [Halorubrum sp. CGM4_25_10-8A]|uniref:signal peptidase I n=1 Tax=Halorubrum sp. CGM4_25_10-8A TaxID=2518116 RepID=UPI0010F5D96A|nr:signal peptidase I [Halorubrum sp. CGM4_25_10-8A]TKX40016.1 signal peptidase I [Halorubrum sp. CGM4_25_10-8A]
MLQTTAERAGTALLVVVLVSLVLGQVLGQPVLLAYVDSGSMEPTIDEGDGFLTMPAIVTGPPAEGDVITFRAQEIEGGGLTTHRVVEETGQGYITRGDANPFTDQDGGEPPVTQDRIVATAVQVGGTVITIPGLGTAIEAIQGGLLTTATAIGSAVGLTGTTAPGSVGTWVFGLGLVLFVLSFRPDDDEELERDVSRTTDDAGLNGRVVAAVLLVIVLVPANAAMVLPSGETTITVDGSEVAEAESVAPGDPVEAAFDAQNNGLITLLLIFEPADEDVIVEPTAPGIPSGESATATVTVPAPEPSVDRDIVVREYRYIVVLPESIILALHDIHPFAALGAINLLIGGGFVGFVGGLIGFGDVRIRDTSRELPLRVRVKQWLR